MKEITKKRLKAYMIDHAVNAAVTAFTEYLLRKKVKSEAVHNLVTPSVIAGTLEFAQLYTKGQTVGYRLTGLQLEDENGGKPSGVQIAKRIVYRESVSGIQYFTHRKTFEQEGGRQLPQDRFAGTIVEEA
ncbi:MULTISPECIES: RDD family protein [Sporosarcina]|uniref:RDD family protein n=1 Tax=Sporosarcina TaxID=1569 RepID=UPI00058C8402|nr:MULTISPECIES: RDD family protein [Sporosarcina]WJY28043.1 RDD family protein [Sporosarcina sp. 0.2-SM1T-5]